MPEQYDFEPATIADALNWLNAQANADLIDDETTEEVTECTETTDQKQK